MAIFGLPTFGGCWGCAHYDLKDRMHATRWSLNEIGPGRGGRLPDRQQLEAEIRRRAEEHAVEVEVLDARVGPIGPQGSNVGALREQLEKKKAPGGMYTYDADLKYIRSEIFFVANARADKWLWSEAQEITVQREFRGSAISIGDADTLKRVAP